MLGWWAGTKENPELNSQACKQPDQTMKKASFVLEYPQPFCLKKKCGLGRILLRQTGSFTIAPCNTRYIFALLSSSGSGWKESLGPISVCVFANTTTCYLKQTHLQLQEPTLCHSKAFWKQRRETSLQDSQHTLCRKKIMTNFETTCWSGQFPEGPHLFRKDHWLRIKLIWRTGRGLRLTDKLPMLCPGKVKTCL